MLKNIDKNIVMLGWVSFFTDMSTAMITPILPIFIVSVLHEGYDKLGFIVAIATFASYGLRLVSGYISDRYGIIKPLVVGGYLLSALSKPLFAFSSSWKTVAVLEGIERFGKGLRSAPKDLLISSFTQSKREGHTFGFHKTMDIAGELTGALMLFGALAFWGQSEHVIRMIFLSTLFPGLIAVIIVTFFVKDAPASEQRLKFSLQREDIAVIKKLMFYFLFIFFFFSDAFFTMSAKENGIETYWIPLLFVLSSATQTLFSLPIGNLIDTFSHAKVLSSAYLFGLLSMLLLLHHGQFSLMAAYLFLGLFTVTSLNANRAYIARFAFNKGSIFGIFYAGIAFFGALGAIVCGMLWQHFGALNAQLFSVMGVSFTLLLYLWSNRHAAS